MKTVLSIIVSELKKARVTRAEISRQTGITESNLCRILKGETKHITAQTVDALLNFFGYEIRKRG